MSWLWAVLFYGLWGYWLIYELLYPSTTNIPFRAPFLIGSTAVAFALFGWFLWQNGKKSYSLNIEIDPKPALIVFQCILIIWFIQIFIAPLIVWTLSGLLAIIYTYLPLRPSIAYIFEMFIFGGIGTSNVVGYGPFSFWGTLSHVTFFTSFALVTSIFAVWIHRVIEQSNDRRELIEELQTTQALLAQAEHERGILAERQRLSHEIHDTLAQGFTSIIMEMEAAEGATKLTQKNPLDHILKARETARRNLEQVRHVLQDLRTEPNGHPSIQQVLRQEVEAWSNQSGIAADFKVTGQTVNTCEEVSHTLLRVTQESLTNIRKYADANDVSVTLSFLSDCLILDVQDDGVGLEETIPAEKNILSGGIGIPTMTERVENLGGTLTIESLPQLGTTVVAQIPIS